MKCLMKLSSIGLALAMMLTTIAQAQEERQGRDGAGQERGQQKEGQGQRQRRGGEQGGRGGQGGGRGIGGSLDKMTLIGFKPIQEELKLDEDELFLINKLVEDHRAETRELFSGIDFRSMSEEERRAKFTELTKKRAELSKESEKGLAEFLTAEQSKRLDEIALQLRGTRALAEDGVAKKLKLSDDQQKKVVDEFASADAERRKVSEDLRASATGGGGGDRTGLRERFEGMREKMEASRKRSDTKVLAVLSADQKKQFEDMKGKPFDRSALGGRGGQAGGGRGGQQGRGGQGGEGGRRGGGDRGERPEGERGGGGKARPKRAAADE
jgi:hypothetical protein